MRVHQLFMFFLLLCGGGPVLIRAEIPVYTAAEGRNLKVRCLFYESGSRKFFCKNVCNKTEDILVETTSFRHQNGRYSIRYEKHSSYPDVMHVSITDVRSSDSGPYSCGLETGSGPIKFMEFMVKGPNSATSPSSPVDSSLSSPVDSSLSAPVDSSPSSPVDSSSSAPVDSSLSSPVDSSPSSPVDSSPSSPVDSSLSAPVDSSPSSPVEKSTAAHIYHHQTSSIPVQKDQVSSGPSPLQWLLLVLILVVMVMASMLLLMRRRKKRCQNGQSISELQEHTQRLRFNSDPGRED